VRVIDRAYSCPPLDQHHAFGIDLNPAAASAAENDIIDANHVIACRFKSGMVIGIGPWRERRLLGPANPADLILCGRLAHGALKSLGRGFVLFGEKIPFLHPSAFRFAILPLAIQHRSRLIPPDRG